MTPAVRLPVFRIPRLRPPHVAVKDAYEGKNRHGSAPSEDVPPEELVECREDGKVLAVPDELQDLDRHPGGVYPDDLPVDCGDEELGEPEDEEDHGLPPLEAEVRQQQRAEQRLNDRQEDLHALLVVEHNGADATGRIGI